jgi:hypothetical protein
MANMSKEIELVPGGGRYYRAMTFHWVVVAVLIVPVAAALIVAIVNPLWFRSAMFDWVERGVNRLSQWRNYQKYRIYLGTDPKMWHTLRGDLK